MEIKADHICKSYGAITILKDISFSLERGQKVGLVGNNGVGKSTLLKILAGIIKPDDGSVIVRKGLAISYVPQDASLITDETVYDYLRREAPGKQLATSSEMAAKDGYKDSYSFDHRVELILAGFGLSKIKGNQPINFLSPGQKSKVFMAGILLSNPDLLLLDEPTNNLDLPALIWLEGFIKQLGITSIIISHDRLFLDRVVSKIFEINWHTRTLRITKGRYSDYLVQVKKERERQRREYEEQREEVKRLVKTVRVKKLKAIRGSHFQGSDHDKFQRGFKRDRAAKSGKTAKAIEKRIEQMEPMEKPVERDVFRIPIRPLKPGGSRSIILDQAAVGYSDGDFRIGPVTITISYGSRVVILGPNGIGKSTLLKTMGGELKPLAGRVEIGRALVVGNLMQEHDNLPRQKSIKDFLMQRANTNLSEAYNLAVKFGFRAIEMDKKISSLSPGARSRLLLALFSSLSANVLLLDEPTNHLDLEALEALEEVVTHYKGTIILISHDRHFLQKFQPTTTYLLSEGKLIRQQSFEAYLAKAEREAKRLIRMLTV